MATIKKSVLKLLAWFVFIYFICFTWKFNNICLEIILHFFIVYRIYFVWGNSGQLVGVFTGFISFIFYLKGNEK